MLKPAKEINRRTILFVTCVGAFMTSFMGSSLNVALPLIGAQFSMNAITLSWVSTAYLLAAATAMLPMGRIADLFGRKKIFSIGLGLFSVACVLIGLSASASLLLAFRVLQGLSAAMLFSTATPILVSAFSPRERGRVLGINVASVYLGLSLGPFVGGLLTQQFGWRSVFAFGAVLCLGVLALVMINIPDADSESEKDEKLDLIGTLFYSVSVVVLMIGFSSLPAVRGAVLLLLGLIGLAGFGAWELRAASPVLDLRLLFRNPAFAFSNLAALINYCATFAVVFLLSLYLQLVKGLSPPQAGLLLVVQPAVQAALSPLAGRLSDRVQPQVLASFGMGLTAAALVLLTRIHTETPISFLVATLALLGLSFAFFSSPNTNAVMSSVEPKYLGVASGMLGTMRLTGQMFSMGVATLLFALFMGSSKIVPEHFPLFIKSVQTAFSIFAVLCVFGIFASLARGKIARS